MAVGHTLRNEIAINGAMAAPILRASSAFAAASARATAPPEKLDIHWYWIKCTHCPHMRAIAIAPYTIRWGPVGWHDMLRRAARCTNCRHRGVGLQHPSWNGFDSGWAPMPIGEMAPVPPLS